MKRLITLLLVILVIISGQSFYYNEKKIAFENGCVFGYGRHANEYTKEMCKKLTDEYFNTTATGNTEDNK